MKYEELAALSTEQLEAELAKRKKVADIAAALAANPLKCEEVTTITVDSSDLEAFIFTVFGVRYESASVEEQSNDTQRRYGVKGFDPTLKYDMEYNLPAVERFLFQNDKKEPALSYLLNYLADKNYIAKGEYTVKWSW